MHNAGVPGTHWASFELAGTKSNRLAIGARIVITAGGVRQMDEVRSGGSYLSQNDLRVHFGLGKSDRSTPLKFNGPPVQVDKMFNLRSDHFYAVLEGTGSSGPLEDRPAHK